MFTQARFTWSSCLTAFSARARSTTSSRPHAAILHARLARRVLEHGPPELRQRLTELELTERLRGAGADRDREGDRVQPPAEPLLELVHVLVSRAELRQGGERRAIEERHVRGSGEVACNPLAADAGLGRDRPDRHRRPPC
jgi:hypothetical protein